MSATAVWQRQVPIITEASRSETGIVVTTVALGHTGLSRFLYVTRRVSWRTLVTDFLTQSIHNKKIDVLASLVRRLRQSLVNSPVRASRLPLFLRSCACCRQSCMEIFRSDFNVLGLWFFASRATRRRDTVLCALRWIRWLAIAGPPGRQYWGRECLPLLPTIALDSLWCGLCTRWPVPYFLTGSTLRRP